MRRESILRPVDSDYEGEFVTVCLYSNDGDLVHQLAVDSERIVSTPLVLAVAYKFLHSIRSVCGVDTPKLTIHLQPQPFRREKARQWVRRGGKVVLLRDPLDAQRVPRLDWITAWVRQYDSAAKDDAQGALDDVRLSKALATIHEIMGKRCGSVFSN